MPQPDRLHPTRLVSPADDTPLGPRRFAVHLAAHMLAPSTLGYGLTDSPVGMLAWLLERWMKWSDNGSIRTYANNNRYPWTPSHDRAPVIEAPTGITFVDYENPPGVNSSTERIESFVASDRAPWYNHTNITTHPRGGHFIPWEIPEQWTADLVRTFTSRSKSPADMTQG